MSIGTRNMMEDVGLLEKGVELLILTTPVSLDGYDFLIKQAFNKILKLSKFLKHLKFVLKKINPSKFAEIINETYIVFIISNGNTGWPPHIGKYEFQWSFRNTRGSRVR
jgi:hypothetical protein